MQHVGADRDDGRGGASEPHQPQPQPQQSSREGDPSECLGGLHGAGGEYEVVGPTDAGAALGSLAGSLIGSVGAGVVGASLGASAAAVTGAAGMGAALGAALGHSFGGGAATASLRGRGGRGGEEFDGGDVPLIGDEDVAIERASRAADAADEPRGTEAEAEAAEVAPEGEGKAEVPELIGLQPLCEMGVNAGMYLGHGHTVAAEAEQ